MTKSKQKGNSYENNIAKLLRTQLIQGAEELESEAYALIHRTPLSGGHVERGDIIIKSPVLDLFPFFIECRNREAWSWKNLTEKKGKSVLMQWMVEDAWEKCHPHEGTERHPLLIFTKKYRISYVAFFVEDYVNLKGVLPSYEWYTIIPFHSLFGVYGDRVPKSDVIITDLDSFLSYFEPIPI